MSCPDIMPLDTSAYIADTTHLSLPQHGAYLLILMTMWRAGGWLADDDRILANVVKLSVPKWRKIAEPVRALLLVRDGKLSQKRLLLEIENASKKIPKSRAKSLKNKEPTPENSGFAPTTVESTLPLLTTLLPSDSEQEDRTESKEGERSLRSSGRSLPVDWQISRTDFEYGQGLGLSTTQIRGMAEDMRLWAQANSNRAVGRKADWTATFRGWMRRDSHKFLHRRGGRGGAPTLVDLALGNGRPTDEH